MSYRDEALVLIASADLLVGSWVRQTSQRRLGATSGFVYKHMAIVHLRFQGSIVGSLHSQSPKHPAHSICALASIWSAEA